MEYLVVGAGLTGSTIARLLADAGREVVVIERQNEVGGRVKDEVHNSGIPFHSHGPHYFRTDSLRVWDFVNRFDCFRPFEAKVMTEVDGQLFRWPLHASEVSPRWGPCVPAFGGVPSNFEQASLAMMSRPIYETFVKEYTEKQWGAPATSLSASLAGRFEIRNDGELRLSRHRWQGLPKSGYTTLVQRMLTGIHVISGCDYLQFGRDHDVSAHVIYTGAIDELFDFDLGRLRYRTQGREHTYLRSADMHQEVVQINNPLRSGGSHIRTIEWKHLLEPEARKEVFGTLLTRETPGEPARTTELEYPFPDAVNRALYDHYRSRVACMPGLTVAGRLGDYRYYDMDIAIGRAMDIVPRLLGRPTGTGRVNKRTQAQRRAE